MPLFSSPFLPQHENILDFMLWWPHTSGHMEMNKQVEPIDIFWASGIYVAFLHRCHPRTSECFPGIPWGVVHGSAVPLPHYR